MRALHNILRYLTYAGNSEKYLRRYRLIQYITWELIVVCTIITSLYAISKLWYLVIIILMAIGLALLNLWILSQTKNAIFCSHVITLIIFITIASANYLIWGMGPLHSQWFYVMPILAASLTGMIGLFIYAAASLVMLITFDKLSLPPYYDLPAYQFMVIEALNHIFAYIIIVTTLTSLIHENEQFERELYDKNYLLQTEKEKYHYLARFDHLTNLPNRRYFIQHLHEIMEAITPNHRITVFFIDLDNFKLVNDSYGHNIGDQLLLETSRRLRSCFREEDFIARLGGDEFTATVVHAPGKQTPEIIAERIISEFDHSFIFENNMAYRYALSIGFAIYPEDAQTASDLIVKADLAMYSAKKITGNSFCSTLDSSS